MGIVELENISTFDDSLKEDRLIVLDFYADWCGPCKKLSPLLKKLSEIYNRVLFYKVNVENSELEKLVKKYGVISLPTLIFFKKGEEVHRIVGYLENEIVKCVMTHST